MQLFTEKERAEKAKIYERAFNGEVIENVDHLTTHGLDLYFQVKHAPVRDTHGNINTIVIFAKDVTELTKATEKTNSLLNLSQQQAEELRAQEEELRQNMEEIHAQQEDMQQQLQRIVALKESLEARELVISYSTILSEADLFGTITFVNTKFCEVSGYSKEELLGKPHNILRHPDMPKELFKKMWNTIKKGEVFKGIIKNKAKDGSHYWVDTTVVPIKGEDGKIIKYIGSRYHITNEAIAEQLFKDQFEK